MTIAKRGRAEWVALVQELRASGLTHTEFAEKHAITTHALDYWCVELKKEERSAAGAEFVPVHVVASAQKARQEQTDIVEAALRSGLVLRFAVGTDTRYLAELFAALG
jgi:hypothetical protein